MNQLVTLLGYYVRTRYRSRFRGRDQLLAWQQKRVEALLRDILPRSPFYREHIQGYEISEWEQFPTIDKTIMMNNFGQLNTVGISKEEAFAVALGAEETRDFSPMIGDITVGLSSGTSGNRGLFLVSPRERAGWAGTMLAKVLPGPLWERQRVAFFLRANSNLYTTVNRGPIRFSFFDLLDPLESHLQRLINYQPTILVSPPSMLRFLAEAQRTGQLSIHPRKVISVAEVLDPRDEQVIASAFEQKIHQVYQCTEGFLATTCSHGTLHLNEDLVVIQKEYLDKKLNKFMPIITDFSRTTQPIIRYRLNDLLTERTTPCPCGSVMTAIEQIEGRSDDLFYLPANNSDKLIPVFPDFIRRAILAASSEIMEYRVIQQDIQLLEIALRLPEAQRTIIEMEVSSSLQKLWQRVGCRAPKIRYTPYTHHPSEQKLRRVERRFSLHYDDQGIAKLG